MVMLAEAIALEGGIDDYKIVLVTDRVDLDDQIYRTFHHCGTVPVQAKTGKHLAELLRDNKARIITTVIDKFELAVSKAGRPRREPGHLRARRRGPSEPDRQVWAVRRRCTPTCGRL
jgi:type I site-specific restriction-modification system R (restriction) subunit